MNGFHGRLLRVDLSGQSFSDEQIPEEILKRFLGGKGLGSYLLLKNVAARVDPLGPENKIIFTTGPATGSRMLGGSRHGLYSKSPLTGGYAESYAGGKVASKIKSAGYDAIILEGKSTIPVVLEISASGAKFHPAGDLWGKETYEAEDKVLERVGAPDAQAVVIGPAGENMVRLACVQNNYWRSSGRGGMGAVMGSKKVKAVVFYGNKPSPISDEAMLKNFVSKIVLAGKDLPSVKNYRKYGTPQMVALLNMAQAFPTRYWSRGSLEGWENISGEALIDNFDVRPKSCPNCILACGNLTTVKSGPQAGLKIEGPEYETIYSFGGLCCINSLEEILRLNDICDRLGLDTISAGNLVALAMEARERGINSSMPAYGDAEGAANLLIDMAYRRGLGGIFSDGIKIAAKHFNLEDIAVHVKGMEPPGYDPRILKGVGLGYATSARGACHLRATFYKPELSGMIPPSAVINKAALYVDFEDRLTIFNTMIVCVFYRDMLQWPELQTLIKSVTGWDYSVDELRKIANNIITMSRHFNMIQGLDRTSDSLPRSLYKPYVGGSSSLTEDELNYMLGDYYKIRGWDTEGKPKTVIP